MTEIDDSIWKLFASIFSQFENIQEVILFGSRAKGTHKNGSDIDLCLKGLEIDTEILIKLMGRIDALDLPYQIDLVIYEKISNLELKDHIKRVGQTIYTKK